LKKKKIDFSAFFLLPSKAGKLKLIVIISAKSPKIITSNHRFLLLQQSFLLSKMATSVRRICCSSLASLFYNERIYKKEPFFILLSKNCKLEEMETSFRFPVWVFYVPL
jgi:hypothetical protein